MPHKKAFENLQVSELTTYGHGNLPLITVKTHINNIFFKLGVKNRKDAAKTYIQHNDTQKSTFSPPDTV